MKDAMYLVLDMENDLVHADGPNGKAGYAQQVQGRQILSNTRRALDKARAAGLPVGFVRVGFSPDYRSEEHTSELQSLMRLSYAVFCLNKKHLVIHHHTQ